MRARDDLEQLRLLHRLREDGGEVDASGSPLRPDPIELRMTVGTPPVARSARMRSP
jgi:hypothetical protein